MKLSVVIITYNHEKFIRQCLDGVLMQKCNFDFEILIGDDASTDGTTKICQEYASKYPNLIRYFLRDKKDKYYINGTAVGRKNFLGLLSDTKGDYVARIDGDDYWTDETKLQQQVDFLDANPEYSACYNGCKHVDEEDNVIKESRFIDYKSPTADKLLTGQGAMITNSVMFRNVVDGFPDIFAQVPSGDTILYHLLGFHGHGKFLPEIGYSAYRIHGGGIWSGINQVRRMHNTFLTLSAIKQNLTSHFGVDSPHVKKMSVTTFYNIREYLFNNLKKGNLSVYFKLLGLILKQNSFSKFYLLKEHFIDLLKRIFKR